MSSKVPSDRIKANFMKGAKEIDKIIRTDSDMRINLGTKRYEAAVDTFDKNSPTWKTEELVEAGWSPFHGFYFKNGWSRIIFHDCKDGVRPYVCGDTIDFSGCKVCEKLMSPEVWAARELLRDWRED